MSNDAMPEEWEILRDWLPANLDERARTQQFFQRKRGLVDGEKWLRLILMHVAGGLSWSKPSCAPGSWDWRKLVA
jgi:hypothetical protein